jgi:hypothetical protein
MCAPHWGMGIVFPNVTVATLCGGSKSTKADFQSLLYHAVVTTVVTSILCMGVTLLRKSPDSSGSDSSAVVSLCVWSAKGFPRSFAGFRPWV